MIIYGIKNCDTMKKTFSRLEAGGKSYVFHDYKKQGVDEAVLQRAFATFGWEQVLNRKGMTWRKLPEDIRQTMSEAQAFEIAIANPSILRRPLFQKDDGSLSYSI